MRDYQEESNERDARSSVELALGRSVDGIQEQQLE